MNSAFWDLFGPDYAQNCLKWTHAEQPILPPSGSTWKSRWTANPDIVEFRGQKLLLYRGNGQIEGRDGLHDRIGASVIEGIAPGILELTDHIEGRPVIDVGSAGEFDSGDVLDPAGVVYQDRLFIYYSAVGAGEDSIGLAYTDDGKRYHKVGRVQTGRAPEVVVKNGRIFLFYQLKNRKGHYTLHLSSSEDGYSFRAESQKEVFSRTEGSWDSASLVTARISEDAGTYYMVYGGSSYLADEPDFFGLARSTDLLNWEPHPGNPIFGCGPKGAPDGGAIWFPALTETDNHFVMLYEGSRGKYTWDLSSAICQAWIKKT